MQRLLSAAEHVVLLVQKTDWFLDKSVEIFARLHKDWRFVATAKGRARRRARNTFPARRSGTPRRPFLVIFWFSPRARRRGVFLVWCFHTGLKGGELNSGLHAAFKYMLCMRMHTHVHAHAHAHVHAHAHTHVHMHMCMRMYRACACACACMRCPTATRAPSASSPRSR